MRERSDLLLGEGEIFFTLFSRVSPKHPWIVEQTTSELWVCKARQNELKNSGLFACIARCHVLMEVQDEERA